MQIVYRIHDNDETGFVNVPSGIIKPYKLIEKCQKNLAKLGRQTGLTWRLVDLSDIAKLLAETTKI